MGEAKQKEERLQLVKDFESSDRQLMALTIYLLNYVTTKNMTDMRRFNRVFEQLGLEKYEDRHNVDFYTLSTEGRQCNATVDALEYIISTIPRDLSNLPGVPGNLVRNLGPLVEKLDEVLRA